MYHGQTYAPLRESEVLSPSEMMAIGDTFGGRESLSPRKFRQIRDLYNTSVSGIKISAGIPVHGTRGASTSCFAMVTSNHQRWDFFLQTRAMRRWSAGIVITCRTEIGYDNLRSVPSRSDSSSFHCP